MTAPIRWGVLGAANIALTKVIPGMQKSARCDIRALASRDPHRAQAAARRLNIPVHYGSYEALLADPDIEAVYIPLPNHLHVPWTLKAMAAGKHVLCEKPIGLNTEEVRQLIVARDRHGVHAEEAFMVRYHPQWLRARELIRQGAIGELRAVQTSFSFFNDDPANYRNQRGTGGGSLYDIGCYAVVAARFLFGDEPRRVCAAINEDARFGVDRMASGVLEFEHGHASFTCSTQMTPYQRVLAFGTLGRLEVEIPFNAPPDAPCRLYLDRDGALADRSRRAETLDIADQYVLQGEAFARTVRGEQPAPYPLEDALCNMRVLDALFRSGKSGRWEAP